MKSDKNLLNCLSFFALVIVAVLIVVNNLLPLVGIEIKGMLFSILNTVKEVFILIVIGLSAYNFIAYKSKTWKIIYWVGVALFVAGVVLSWF